MIGSTSLAEKGSVLDLVRNARASHEKSLLSLGVMVNPELKDKITHDVVDTLEKLTLDNHQDQLEIPTATIGKSGHRERALVGRAVKSVFQGLVAGNTKVREESEIVNVELEGQVIDTLNVAVVIEAGPQMLNPNGVLKKFAEILTTILSLTPDLLNSQEGTGLKVKKINFEVQVVYVDINGAHLETIRATTVKDFLSLYLDLVKNLSKQSPDQGMALIDSQKIGLINQVFNDEAFEKQQSSGVATVGMLIFDQGNYPWMHYRRDEQHFPKYPIKKLVLQYAITED